MFSGIKKNDLRHLNQLLRTDKLQTKFQEHSTGKTLLHFAIEANSEPAVAYLLTIQPNVDFFIKTTDNQGKSPLDYAKDRNLQTIIDLLQKPDQVLEKSTEMLLQGFSV